MTTLLKMGLCNIASGVALLAAVSLYGCHANEVPENWKADCVGRMQLSFPGEVEVAAHTAAMLEKEYKIGSIQPRFEFADGQYSGGWSRLHYLGSVYPSHPLTDDEKERLVNAARQAESRTRDWARKNKKDRDGQTVVYEELDTKPFVGVAGRLNAAYDASLFVGDSLFWISLSGADKTWADQRKVVNDLLAGLASRPVGRIPSKPGICMPYVFVEDHGRPPRYVAMTYRLREHPDVTIMFEDRNAVEVDPKANPAVYDPESISDDFWSRYDDIYRKSLRGVWNIPYKRAKLDNSKGVESFVKIVRKDDTVDYGYLVVTKGDPAAKEDTPDLMLYVVQDSKNAKAKGIAPMEKEAFLSMAQTIAASVKRRPTSP